MKKLLVFAGSFDPFHNAHYMLLKLALANQTYDQVVLSISHQNPLKDHVPVSYDHRLKMAQLGLYELKDQVVFDEFEHHQATPSYTVDLIRHLQQVYPGYEITYLLGSDSFETINQWKDIDQYFHDIHWLVAGRSSDIQFEAQANVSLLIAPLMNISSSKIRQGVTLVDMNPQALNYLNEYGLYAQERVLSYTTPKRFEHILRVAQMTQDIMQQYEPEHAHWGWTAGIYHDIAKSWSFDFQGDLGTYILKMPFSTPKILHGYIGAEIMKTQYLFTNEIIVNAVARHTKPFDDYPKGHQNTLDNLTNLDMALYCADKLEPARTEEDCTNIDYYRELLKIDLKRCFDELYHAIQNQFHKEDK